MAEVLADAAPGQLTNPRPVRLTDGTSAIGADTNPLPVSTRQEIRTLLETSTPLGVGGTFNGADRLIFVGLSNQFGKFRAQAFADQAGTLNIQQSRDGTTWRTTKTQAIVANTALTLEDITVRQHVRAQVVNGGVAQTVLEVDSALVAI